MTLAALFVDPGGCYQGIPSVDLWDEGRDARLYPGPHPVVAHPPCARWCRLAGLVEARWGHRKGDDGGTFAAALEAVRAWGGVLEHPAYSDAFRAHGLAIPSTGGTWEPTLDGGFVAYVEQWRYGHPAKKATWLYAYNPHDRAWTPLPLKWGHSEQGGFTVVEHQDSKGARSATPPEFRDRLLDIAGTARREKTP